MLSPPKHPDTKERGRLLRRLEFEPHSLHPKAWPKANHYVGSCFSCKSESKSIYTTVRDYNKSVVLLIIDNLIKTSKRKNITSL